MQAAIDACASYRSDSGDASYCGVKRNNASSGKAGWKMKRGFAAWSTLRLRKVWSTAGAVWSEALTGFMFFFAFFKAKKWRSRCRLSTDRCALKNSTNLTRVCEKTSQVQWSVSGMKRLRKRNEMQRLHKQDFWEQVKMWRKNFVFWVKLCLRHSEEKSCDFVFFAFFKAKKMAQPLPFKHRQVRFN